MSDPPRLGELGGQRYTDPQVAKIAKDAAPDVRGQRHAGKVYCPYCKLREARWKRSYDEERSDVVHLFIYCTQCHKTGVTDIDFSPEAVARRVRSHRIRWILVLLALAALLWLLVVS